MSETSPPPPTGIREVLALPAFRRLWLSQVVSVFGDFIVLYAVIAVVSFQMHGTPRQVTLITVFFLLPFALIGPIAGVFVDRWNPKQTMILSDLVRAVLILGLVFTHAPWQVYAVIFTVSAVSSFFVPAQSVVLPQIVPTQALLSANAAMQQAVQLVRIISPALSGAMVGWAGSSLCYYLDSASFLASAAMIWRIDIPPRPAHANQHVDSVLKDLFSGMRFIFTHQVMAFVITSMAAGTFALSAFGALTAIYVRDVLKQGSYMFGALGSLIGGGMLVGSLALARFGKRIDNKAPLIIMGLVGCGINIGIIAFAGTTAVTVAGCLGIGLSSALLIIPAMTMMQGQVPNELRGRVNSSAMSVITLAQGVAMLFAGDLASRYGIVAVYYGSAILLMLIAASGFQHLRKQANRHAAAG